jgi:hypothetical protein
VRRAVVATAAGVVAAAGLWIASSRLREAPGGGVGRDASPAATAAPTGASPPAAGDATGPAGEHAVGAQRTDGTGAPAPLQVITRPTGGEPSVAASPDPDAAASLERRRAFWSERFQAYQEALRAVRDDPALDAAAKAAEAQRLHREAFGEEARRAARALADAPEAHAPEADAPEADPQPRLPQQPRQSPPSAEPTDHRPAGG